MKKSLTKPGKLGFPQKGQKQVNDLQCNAVSYMYIPSSLCAVTPQGELGMYITTLHWRSVTCFCPLCGTPIYPVFVNNFHCLYMYVHIERGEEIMPSIIMELWNNYGIIGITKHTRIC